MARNSSAALAAEIAEKIRRDAEVRVKSKEQAEEVRDYARSIAPVRTGKFAASIKVEKRGDGPNGLPHYWVGTRDWRAHFIEYGTGPDPDDSQSPFGPNTPTPEFAVFAKIAAHFGGTTDSGIEAEVEVE